MSKHTPGPWKVFNVNEIRQEKDGYRTLATTCTDAAGAAGVSAKSKANAARIVECVNALEGVENPAALPTLLRKLKHEIEGLKLIDCEATADRIHEALAALGVK